MCKIGKEVVMEPTIGEYAANDHIAFCKSIGILIVPEQCKDFEKLKALKQQYYDWSYQKNLVPSDKDEFFHTLYELGIIDAKHLRAMRSPWPADTRENCYSNNKATRLKHSL